MYAQFEGLPSGVTDKATLTSPWYESWSCNLKYYTDVSNVSKDKMIETIFYEGSKLVSSQKGTYQSANALQ